MKYLLYFGYLLIAGFSPWLMPKSHAGQVRVAVAANFSAAMNALRTDFERSTGHKLISSFASSGKLYAQIVNGAPFDVLLSADKARPEKLQQSGLGVPNTRFTYARGKLVLMRHVQSSSKVSAQHLGEARFEHLAIANPKIAPYGKAAMQVLQKLDLLQVVEEKIVQGDNIAQVLQYVYSGAADYGFIAFSQIKMLQIKGIHSNYWKVPDKLYSPIEQQAILLATGRTNQAAHDFLNYLKQQHVVQIIVSMGYAQGDIEGVLP